MSTDRIEGIATSAGPTRPPLAPRKPTRVTLHGVTREDPYAWLRADNWRDVMRDPAVLDAEIRAYLEAENVYTEAAMAPTATLQQQLFAEMKGRIKEDDSSVPSPDGLYAYYQRFETGGQHPVFCRCPADALGGGWAADGSGREGEQVLLDGNREAEGENFFRVGACEHSPDHGLLAYAVDRNGSERYRINVKDLSNGTLLPDTIEEAQGSLVWANDGRTLFYVTLDEEHRPSKVYRHRLGDDTAADVLVYEEPDPGFFVGLSKTESDRFIVISAHDHTTSEARVVDAAAPESAPVLIAVRERGLEYDVSDHGARFLILTNADGAIDFKIVEAPIATPGRAQWRDLVPHRPGCLILGLEVFKDYLVRLEREAGLPRIVVTAWASGAEHAIAFDEQAYSLGLIPGYLYDTASLRFAYSSLTTPQRVYDYDMASRRRVLRKEQEVPSGHNADDYVARRILARAHDGEEVPVSLVYRKTTPLDGSAPLLLYGYGSYGHAIPAAFSTNRFSLIDRGFIYAIAHIRGGTDKGYGWYLDGKLDKKSNSFRDFISAAEALIGQGFTRAGQIVGHGGSAGGLLMGAVANLRPDLFRGIVAEVPFVDVLTTMCDKDLPLTPPEWPEWGNPLESLEAYRTIAAYSPCDNVEAKAYPAILATAGLTDPRVTYWEPAKWVARLRAAKTDDNLLLLKTVMTAGHGGASGRFDKLHEVALSYAFALLVCGKAGRDDLEDV
ncbi:MAG: prolyl oligopeptidase family serine peptidase [Kiloniellaceae bacterium]|nr:prolyl oligopeptidase family serine peptidase [Kiloniellaceae bacterium]